MTAGILDFFMGGLYFIWLLNRRLSGVVCDHSSVVWMGDGHFSCSGSTPCRSS